MEDYLELIPLDPQWRCFFEGSSSTVSSNSPSNNPEQVSSEPSVLDLVSDVEQMKKHLNEFTGMPKIAEGYEKFMAVSEQLHQVSNRFFFYRSIGGIKDTMDEIDESMFGVLEMWKNSYLVIRQDPRFVVHHVFCFGR